MTPKFWKQTLIKLKWPGRFDSPLHRHSLRRSRSTFFVHAIQILLFFVSKNLHVSEDKVVLFHYFTLSEFEIPWKLFLTGNCGVHFLFCHDVTVPRSNHILLIWVFVDSWCPERSTVSQSEQGFSKYSLSFRTGVLCNKTTVTSLMGNCLLD